METRKITLRVWAAIAVGCNCCGFAAGYEPPKVEAVVRPQETSQESQQPEQQAPIRAEAAQPQQQRPKTFQDAFNELKTDGDRREFLRVAAERDKAAKINHAIQFVTQNYPSEERKGVFDMLKEQINNAYAGWDLRRVEDTPEFKRASEQFNDKYRQNIDVLANLSVQLQHANQLKDKEEQARFLQTNLPMMLSWIAVAAPYNVGVDGVKGIMSEMSTIFNTPITQWGDLLQLKGATGVFTKDPEAFIKKATELYNIAAKNKNAEFDYWHNALGNHGMNIVGAVKLAPIKTNGTENSAD